MCTIALTDHTHSNNPPPENRALNMAAVRIPKPGSIDLKISRIIFLKIDSLGQFL